MAKAKTPKGRGATSPDPTPTASTSRHEVILNLRGSTEFKAWLAAAAADARVPVSTFIELAVIAHAKAQGFKPPAPKRY